MRALNKLSCKEPDIHRLDILATAADQLSQDLDRPPQPARLSPQPHFAPLIRSQRLTHPNAPTDLSMPSLPSDGLAGLAHLANLSDPNDLDGLAIPGSLVAPAPPSTPSSFRLPAALQPLTKYLEGLEQPQKPTGFLRSNSMRAGIMFLREALGSLKSTSGDAMPCDAIIVLLTHLEVLQKMPFIFYETAYPSVPRRLHLRHLEFCGSRGKLLVEELDNLVSDDQHAQWKAALTQDQLSQIYRQVDQILEKQSSASITVSGTCTPAPAPRPARPGQLGPGASGLGARVGR